MTDNRMIVIHGDGKTEFVGKWKVGDIINAAQGLINTANNVDVEFTPQAQPAPKPVTPQG